MMKAKILTASARHIASRMPINVPTLISLQRDQLLHDSNFHRDIFNLRRHDRIRHLVFHFSKYVGRLVDCSSDQDPCLALTIVDTFIIALSARDALGISTDEFYKQGFEEFISSMVEEPIALDVDPDDRGVKSLFLVALARETGKLAKACEAYDHLEIMDYFGIFQSSVNQILRATIFAAHKLRLDLSGSVKKRWKDIELNGVL